MHPPRWFRLPYLARIWGREAYGADVLHASPIEEAPGPDFKFVDSSDVFVPWDMPPFCIGDGHGTVSPGIRRDRPYGSITMYRYDCPEGAGGGHYVVFVGEIDTESIPRDDPTSTDDGAGALLMAMESEMSFIHAHPLVYGIGQIIVRSDGRIILSVLGAGADDCYRLFSSLSSPSPTAGPTGGC